VNSNMPISAHGLDTPVRPSGQITWPAHAGGAGAHATNAVTTPGVGAADVGLPTAPEWLGLWVKHHRGWVYPLGSKVATGAHRLGVVTMRRLVAAAQRRLTPATGSGGWWRASTVPAAVQWKGEGEERPNR
jgi:hypothetical protein